MITEKQEQLFQSLKMIKDQWVEISLIKLKNGMEIEDLKEQQNEIIESVLCSVMEMIDGYNDNLNYSLDLVDNVTKQSLKEGIQLHDEFIDYLKDVEE
jgi:hypothetical protein